MDEIRDLEVRARARRGPSWIARTASAPRSGTLERSAGTPARPTSRAARRSSRRRKLRLLERERLLDEVRKEREELLAEQSGSREESSVLPRGSRAGSRRRSSSRAGSRRSRARGGAAPEGRGDRARAGSRSRSEQRAPARSVDAADAALPGGGGRGCARPASAAARPRSCGWTISSSARRTTRTSSRSTSRKSSTRCVATSSSDPPRRSRPEGAGPRGQMEGQDRDLALTRRQARRDRGRERGEADAARAGPRPIARNCGSSARISRAGAPPSRAV